MSQSCVWPYGMIYEKPELFVEDVLGNKCSEVLTIEAVTRDCLTGPNSKSDCADKCLGLMTDRKNSSQRGHNEIGPGTGTVIGNG